MINYVTSTIRFTMKDLSDGRHRDFILITHYKLICNGDSYCRNILGETGRLTGDWVNKYTHAEMKNFQVLEKLTDKGGWNTVSENIKESFIPADLGNHIVEYCVVQEKACLGMTKSQIAAAWGYPEFKSENEWGYQELGTKTRSIVEFKNGIMTGDRNDYVNRPNKFKDTQEEIEYRQRSF